jgi:hypothetical protein
MRLSDVHSLCGRTAVVILIGNKSDFESNPTVALAEAEQYAQHHQLTDHEASALSGANVREGFVKVATQIYRKAPKTAKPTRTVPAPAQKSGGCCS